MMLPAVLKVTHIKLQEETDLRVLAEESKNKLKRAIKNASIVHRLKRCNDYDFLITVIHIFFFF